MDELNVTSAQSLAPDVSYNMGAGQTADEEILVDQIKTTPMQQTLAQFILQCYRENRDFAIEKSHHEYLRESQRMCQSEYSAAERAKLAVLGVPEDMFEPITEIKRYAAISQLKDIFNAPGDKIFTLSPTPYPEVPDYITEEALKKILTEFLEVVEKTGEIPDAEAARKFGKDRTDEILRAEQEHARDQINLLETKVRDQMVEGGFIDAFGKFLEYLSVYGTALMEGPIPTVKYVNEYAEKTGKDGVSDVGVKRVAKRILTFRAINPLRVYPSRDQVDIEDGNICIRVSYPVHELWQYALKAKDGDDQAANGHWFRDTVRDFLAVHPTGGVHMVDEDGEFANRELAGQSSWASDKSCMVEGINFYGKVKGNLLIQVGLTKSYDGKKIDEDDYYEVNALVADNHVLYCRLADPCIGRTLCKGVFFNRVDSFYGMSLADKLIPVQRMLNICLRSIVANMSIISLPIYWVKDAGRLLDKSPNALKMYGGKVIPFTSGILGQNDQPIGTLRVDNNLQQIVGIYDKFITRADDVSQIPAYTYGNAAVGGAARTYAGLSMLTEAANRGMKVVINSCDRDIIRKMVKSICDYNILYDKDCPYRGDVNVNPSGVMSLILREQERQKVLQFMQLCLSSQDLLQMIGVQGLMEIFRQVLRTYDIENEDKIIPSKKSLEMQQMLQDMQRAAMVDQQMANTQTAQNQAAMPAMAGGGGTPMSGSAVNGNPTARYATEMPEQPAATGGMPEMATVEPNAGSANERRGSA